MSRAEQSRVRRILPPALLLLGILLVALSFLPIGSRFAESQWTPEDSAHYDKITQEYKRSQYDTAARSGLSEEEWSSQRQRMKQEIDAMNQKLTRARAQPDFWSTLLLWSGAAFAAVGFFLHKRSDPAAG